MPPQCPPIPPHPGQEAGSALPAPHLPQVTTGMPQPPAELRKHLCPRATAFIEVPNPTEGTEWVAPGSVQGSQPRTSSISARTEAERGLFHPFVRAGCSAREGALKARCTCTCREEGVGGVCQRTELLIKIAQSDAIERLVVTLC